MIWLSIVVISLFALAPSFSLLFCRQKTPFNDDQTILLTAYKKKLRDLEHDVHIGLISTHDHDTLQLEIERCILTTHNNNTPLSIIHNKTPQHATKVAWCGLILTPFAALALYLINGNPELPAQPLTPRLIAQHAQDVQEDTLINTLRHMLMTLPKTDPRLQQGYILLGQAEMARNHYHAAVDAYSHALALGFDPEIAARTAEAITQEHHFVTPKALALFRKALATAPKNAPWYKSVQIRVVQGEHEQNHF